MGIQRLNHELAFQPETKTLYYKEESYHVAKAGMDEKRNIQDFQLSYKPYGGQILKLDLSLPGDRAQLLGPYGAVSLSFAPAKRVILGIEEDDLKCILLGKPLLQPSMTPKEGLIRYLSHPSEKKDAVLEHISRIFSYTASVYGIRQQDTLAYPDATYAEAERLKELHLANNQIIPDDTFASLYASEAQKKHLEPKWLAPVPVFGRAIPLTEEFQKEFAAFRDWKPDPSYSGIRVLPPLKIRDLAIYASRYPQGGLELCAGIGATGNGAALPKDILGNVLGPLTIPSTAQEFVSLVGYCVEKQFFKGIADPKKPRDCAAVLAATHQTGFPSESNRDIPPFVYQYSVSVADDRARELGAVIRNPLDEIVDSPKTAYQRALQVQEGMPTEFDCAEHLDWFTAEKDAKAVNTMLDKGYDERLCKDAVQRHSPGLALQAARHQTEKEYLNHVMNMAKHPIRSKGAAR